MKATLYLTLSPTMYVSPKEAPLMPVIPPTTTSVASQELCDQHTEEQRIYINHINMDDALKTKLLDVFEYPYVVELQNRYTGYMGATTRNLLDHLMDWYSNITADDLKPNEARINEAFDHSHLIDVCFQRINDSVQYADGGKNPFKSEKYCKQHSTPSTQPECTERYARNGDKKETPEKYGQISNVTLPLSITR